MRSHRMAGTILGGLRRFPLASFFLIAYAWTWCCWGAIYAGSSAHLPLSLPKDTLATLGQFGPCIAALLVTAGTSGRDGLRELGARLVRWRRVGRIWLGVSLLLLPATMLEAILLHALFHPAITPLRFYGAWQTLPVSFLYTLLLCGPLGEEPGWRGFALPRLQAKYRPALATLLLGLLEACWHLPLWWIYPAPCPFPMFLVGAMLLAFLFTWLFNHTQGSLLFSLLFHASLNTASVRLPAAPAYAFWVWCLLAVVLGILLYDRWLGQIRGAAHGGEGAIGMIAQ